MHGSTIFFNKEPKDLEAWLESQLASPCPWPSAEDLLAIVDDAKQRIVSGSKEQRGHSKCVFLVVACEEAQFIIGRCEVSVYERS